MFDSLKISEIRKAETAANRYYGRNDCKVTGFSAKRCEEPDLGDWYEVKCEICFNYEERADRDVVVSCFMSDRRRSFATVRTWDDS